MKVPAGKVDGFIASMGKGVDAILLYGPDQGHVGERARRAMRRFVDDVGDPFRVADFLAEDLQGEPGRLIEEAQAMSLIGGRRVVRIRQTGNGLAEAFKALFEMGELEAFVIVEAGELAANAALRRLFEKAERAAALPCYRDEGGTLTDLIRSALREAGHSIEPDALQYLQAHLGSDRELTRNELGKLALYMSSDSGSVIRLEDVDAIIGDSSALMIDDLVWSIFTGDMAKSETALARLLAEGQHPVRIVRAISSTLMRLLAMRAEVDSGKPPAQVVAAARPPVHFQRKDVTRRVLDRGTSDRLTQALALAFIAERRCKTTGLPADLMVQGLGGRLAALLGERGVRIRG